MTDPDDADLALRFQASRAHLVSVAFRILGSQADAEDAVQETWLRLHRSESEDIDNLTGWLTTVVSRICLDMLRGRRTRREDFTDDQPGELRGQPQIDDRIENNPETTAILADSIGAALLVVLDSLSPAERLAFVLHDLFAVPFEEISVILDRSVPATRQLASRARRRVQGATPVSAEQAPRRAIVSAFLAASRDGDFAGLLALLSPDAVLRADATAVGFGAEPEVSGATGVAETFSGRAQAARLALVDGVVAAVWSVGGQPRVVFHFAIEDGQIVGMRLQADPVALAEMEWTSLD